MAMTQKSHLSAVDVIINVSDGDLSRMKGCFCAFTLKDNGSVKNTIQNR